MSIKAISLVFDSDIKPSAKKFVLVALADNSNEWGIAYPSCAEIKRKTGLDDRTVQKYLDEFRDEGVIQDTDQRVGRTKQIKVYRLILDKTPKHGGVKDPHSCDETPPFLPETPPYLCPKTPINGGRNRQEPSLEPSKGNPVAVESSQEEPEPPRIPTTKLEAWHIFKEHCAQSHKPVKDDQEREQWALLKAMPEPEAIQVCRDAIASGHTTVKYVQEKRAKATSGNTLPGGKFTPAAKSGYVITQQIKVLEKRYDDLEDTMREFGEGSIHFDAAKIKELRAQRASIREQVAVLESELVGIK
mgnify:CR=1 FL=1